VWEESEDRAQHRSRHHWTVRCLLSITDCYYYCFIYNIHKSIHLQVMPLRCTLSRSIALSTKRDEKRRQKALNQIHCHTYIDTAIKLKPREHYLVHKEMLILNLYFLFHLIFYYICCVWRVYIERRCEESEIRNKPSST
jgi:hypothetical protein